MKGARSRSSDRRKHAERQAIERAAAFAAQQDLERAAKGLKQWCSAQRAQGVLPRQGLETLAGIQLQQQHWAEAIHTLSLIQPALTANDRDRLCARLDAEAYGLVVESRLQPAIAAYCRQLALRADHPQAHRNLASVLVRLGDFMGAQMFALKHLKLFPDSGEGWNTYGNILNELGRYQEAIEAFNRSLQMDPGNSNAISNLANQHHLNASIDLAYVHGSRAVLAAPDNLGIWLGHLTHLTRVCDFDRLEAVDWWALLERQQVDLTAPLFLLTLTLAESPPEQQRLLALQQRWGHHQSERAAGSPLGAPAPLPLDRAEPLRIGFVSADFRDHSVARFIWPLFDPEGGFNGRGFSLHAYSTSPSADP
ncbi:MAG: tetratricopeptide repeat protein, partial [Prochlorococcaceae cyanobacterium]